MITDAAITATRLRELPTLCVTGFTLESTMKLSCWYSWKQSAAMKRFLPATASGMPPATILATFIFELSNASAKGSANTVDAMVSTPSKLT